VGQTILSPRPRRRGPGDGRAVPRPQPGLRRV